MTADALHTQRGHVEYLAVRRAEYVFTVKGNQPTLRTALKDLPWDQVDVAAEWHDKAHGRLEWRSIKVVQVSTGLPFPGRPQAVQVLRRTKRRGETKWHLETVYAITSLPADNDSATRIATILRRHWAIENELHWVRDVTFGEDASHVRTGQGPAIMAALRNLAISLAHLENIQNIASWLRWNSHDAHRPAALLNSS